MERQRFEHDFREALRCGLGPLKLSRALAAILPSIKKQRDLGASWLQISDSLSSVLEAEGRPRVSASTLRGVVRRLSARRPVAARPASAARSVRASCPMRSEIASLPTPLEVPADAVADLAAQLQQMKLLS